MKATHLGTCQICGAEQKLPGNVLAKHGYTKRWGFFSGTCAGSHYLPFEVSTDRIAQGIASARQRIEGIEDAIATLNAAPVTDRAPFHHYETYGQLGSGRYEREAIISHNEQGHIVITVLVSETAKSVYPGSRYGYFTASVAEVVDTLRRERVVRYNKTKGELESYIKWQQKRIADWKPAERKPVSAMRRGTLPNN